MKYEDNFKGPCMTQAYFFYETYKVGEEDEVMFDYTFCTEYLRRYS